MRTSKQSRRRGSSNEIDTEETWEKKIVKKLKKNSGQKYI
jgi:hypothetical protein